MLILDQNITLTEKNKGKLVLIVFLLPLFQLIIFIYDTIFGIFLKNQTNCVDDRNIEMTENNSIAYNFIKCLIIIFSLLITSLLFNYVPLLKSKPKDNIVIIIF